jgi:hypothetical protein
MTIEKSDEELLNSSAPWDLTEDELERKCELERLIQDGVWEPYQVDAGDVADLMSSKNIISEEDGINYTREDEKKLVKVLEDDWDNVNEYDRFVYHIINHTWGVPSWRRPYPPTQEFIQSLKEFLKIDPRTTKLRKWC